MALTVGATGTGTGDIGTGARTGDGAEGLPESQLAPDEFLTLMLKYFSKLILLFKNPWTFTTLRPQVER